MIPADLLSYLIETYHPHSILLHGSRARRDNFDNSDYDLAIISSLSAPIFSHHYKSYDLDLDILSSDKTFHISKQTPTWPLIVVYDDHNKYGHTLLENNRILYEKGPLPLTVEEINNRKNMLLRLLAKLLNRTDSIQYKMHYAGEIHERSIRYYFELSGRWPFSLPKALKIIKEESIEFYNDLENLFGLEAEQAVRNIFKNLFNEII